MRRTLILLSALILSVLPTCTRSSQNPSWPKDRLEAPAAYAREIGSAAVLVLDDGEEVFTYYYYTEPTSETMNFTATSTVQADVSTITALDPNQVPLKEGMTISIYKYDDKNKIDHVITLNDQGERNFTYYYYDGDRLSFTATSTTETVVLKMFATYISWPSAEKVMPAGPWPP